MYSTQELLLRVVQMKLQLPRSGTLKRFDTHVPSEFYNPVRLAQLREGGPIEILLGGRGLHVHLDREAWLVTDRNLGAIPVLAWSGLSPARRDGIHRAVPCELIYYHAYAAVLIRNVLPDVVARLARMAPPAESPATVLPLARGA